MSLSKELLFLILQFCDEENLKKTAHMLELETGIFFNMKYFEGLVLRGNWEEAERYLSGFTGVEDNKYSIKIYFEMRKQKFLEALDEHDRAKALDVLVKDLKVFAPLNEELYKEMTQLLTLYDFRIYEPLSSYGDTASARKQMMSELKNIIEANPLFHGRLEFPQINSSRLRRLINQGLNWQHIQCRYPLPSPEIKTLYVDHQCSQPDNAYGQLSEDNPLPPSTTSASPFSDKSTSNPSAVSQSVISDGSLNLGAPNNQDAILDGVKDSENKFKTICTGHLNEVSSARTLPTQSHSSKLNIPDSLPKTVGRIFKLSFSPTCMHFHPIFQTFLLAGTSAGDIELWEVISGEKLVSRKFRAWKISMASLGVNDSLVSINRILWSPDGSLFGVAYSKHIVQLFSYHGASCIQEQLEIDAHVGGVNDLAFSKPDEQLFIITCGDDKLIQVWDVTTGDKRYTFEGHEAPVYSICAHVKENIHFLFSTSISGEIKAWLYNNLGSRLTYHAPGNGSTRMAYSADGKRLFSCGTNEDGESCIVEWDETEGNIRRAYQGLHKSASGVLQFDTSKNRFLAAGDDHLIKVWDMDNVELLTVIDAEGCLTASPYICFNKKGTLLAVSAHHNKIKILANNYGLQLLQTSERHSTNAFRVLSESLKKIPKGAATRVTDGGGPLADNLYGDTGNLERVDPRSSAEPGDLLEVKDCETSEPAVCQFLRLPSEAKTNKISRLVYTIVGNGILALAADGVHLLWKWSINETNLSGKATTKVSPQLWQPKNGLFMTADLNDSNFAEVMPCFALSKNNSYVVSAAGGPVSLFNMMTFKKMKSFIHPPPAATCIAFYPDDNNVIAIGLDDSTILIYNARVDKVMSRLCGHSKRITGLAFSSILNVLVSSGMDSQIVVWDTVGWEESKSTALDISIEGILSGQSETHVQFHQDQRHFLAVHKTQLAIYEATKLQRVKQWIVGYICAQICHATFSCDSQLICACLCDGAVLIFHASDLHIQYEINPFDYLPSEISSDVYPLVVAANPKEPNQFALGLTDGGVVVIEPLESVGEWCRPPSFKPLR